MKAEITVRGSRFAVDVPYSPVVVDRFRTIPGREFVADAGKKLWTFPLAADTVLMVCDVLGVLPHDLPPEVRAVTSLSPSGCSPPVDLSVLKRHTFFTEPYAHQRQNLARLIGNARWLLADEQGTGKTHAVANRLAWAYRQVAAECERHFDGADPLHLLPRTLILCPKSVVHVWVNELYAHARLRATVVEGNALRRRQIIDSRDRILVANWELLIHSADDLLSRKWDILVGDEVHKVKGFTNQTSRTARELSGRAGYVYALSGTPAPNGLEDWLGVLSFVDPGGVPWQTKGAFEAQHVYKTRLGDVGPWKVSGYRNTAQLHDVVRRYTSRVTKAEALDLPPKVFSTRTVDLSGEQARAYKELKRDAVTRLSSLKAEGTLTVRNVLTERLRLAQVVGGFVSDDDGNVHEFAVKAKWPAVLDLVEEAGDVPVVFWCAFREEVHWLAEKLLELGGTGVTLHGGLSGEQRRRNIEAFQAGDARWFVGTAAAGGSGITLHRGSTTVYYSRGDNLADYLQSQDRQHRIGQTRTVNVIKLIARGTVDEKIDSNLDRKEDLQGMLLGDPAELL